MKSLHPVFPEAYDCVIQIIGGVASINTPRNKKSQISNPPTAMKDQVGTEDFYKACSPVAFSAYDAVARRDGTAAFIMREGGILLPPSCLWHCYLKR